MGILERRFPSIDEREGLDPETFHREYVEKNLPVVLKGAATDWAHRLTPELLREDFGDRKILAERNELYQNQKTQRMLPVSELLDSVFSGSLEWRVRASSAAVLREMPELQSTLDQSAYYLQYFSAPDRESMLSNFWVSPLSNTSVMHHDTFYENLNVMMYGEKHFVFIRPSDTARVYPHFFNESPVNPHKPDLEKHPKFDGVDCLEGMLEEGDILYIPQFWWHFTTALSPTININTWIKSPWPATKKVLATMPLSSRMVYRVLYNQKRYDWFMENMRRIHKAYTRLLPKKKAREQLPAEAG